MTNILHHRPDSKSLNIDTRDAVEYEVQWYIEERGGKPNNSFIHMMVKADGEERSSMAMTPNLAELQDMFVKIGEEIKRIQRRTGIEPKRVEDEEIVDARDPEHEEVPGPKGAILEPWMDEL